MRLILFPPQSFRGLALLLRFSAISSVQTGLFVSFPAGDQRGERIVRRSEHFAVETRLALLNEIMNLRLLLAARTPRLFMVEHGASMPK